MVKRCAWSLNNELMTKYHDQEWGVPVHNDRLLFEFLILEGFQAGLSWQTILNKRQNFKKALDNFDYKKIAKYKQLKLNQLMRNAGIIRNRLKIAGAVKNAKAFIKIQKEFGSFDKYIWSFVGGKPIINKHKSWKGIPATTKISDEISKDLKSRGFTFVGSTIVYAHMQATGMVNDHIVSCFWYKQA